MLRGSAAVQRERTIEDPTEGQKGCVKVERVEHAACKFRWETDPMDWLRGTHAKREISGGCPVAFLYVSTGHDLAPGPTEILLAGSAPEPLVAQSQPQ